MTEEFYRRWLAKRRELSPPATLTDQIMSRIAELEAQQRNIWWLYLVGRIEHSRAGRWAVCGGALAVGSLPFLFFAHVAQFVKF